MFAIMQSPFNLLFPLPELLPLTLLCSRHSIPGGWTKLIAQTAQCSSADKSHKINDNNIVPIQLHQRIS